MKWGKYAKIVAKIQVNTIGVHTEHVFALAAVYSRDLGDFQPRVAVIFPSKTQFENILLWWYSVLRYADISDVPA